MLEGRLAPRSCPASARKDQSQLCCALWLLVVMHSLQDLTSIEDKQGYTGHASKGLLASRLSSSLVRIASRALASAAAAS